MKIEFNIDDDGNFRAVASNKVEQNELTFTSSGKITLEEDYNSIIRKFATFTKELELYCDSNYHYSKTAPSK